MEFETILLKKTDGVGTIQLNRPQTLNPLNMRCFTEITRAVEDLSGDPRIRSVILAGTGKAFSAGGDIKEIESFSPQDALVFRDFMLEVKKAILCLRELAKPVITAVNGLAYGAGFSLALAGDVILASEDAKFCQVFVRVGLVPDAGSTFFLPRLIGTARAFPLIFLGEPIGAKEAESLGMVSKVVPAANLDEEAMNLAQKLAQGPTRAMGLAKKLVYGGLEKTLAEQLDDEASIQVLCSMTQDHREGIRAFKEKRNPQFQGK